MAAASGKLPAAPCKRRQQEKEKWRVVEAIRRKQHTGPSWPAQNGQADGFKKEKKELKDVIKNQFEDQNNDKHIKDNPDYDNIIEWEE